MIVQLAAIAQFSVGARVDFAPAIHDDDRIGANYGRETVDEDDGDAMLQYIVERLLHQMFTMRFERRGGLARIMVPGITDNAYR